MIPKLAKKWFLTHTAAMRPVKLSRPIRLHAERLEDRCLMSANDPASAAKGHTPAPISDHGEIGVAASQSISSQLARPTAALARPAQSSAESTTAVSQRFRSNEDFRNWLIQAATEQWGQLFGQHTLTGYLGDFWNYNGGVVAFADFQVPGVANMLNATTSTTNVQVEGVDEADLVETDGDYLYILSKQDLAIVRAGEGADLEVISRVHLEGTPEGMYLSGNRLAIVSSSGVNFEYGGLGQMRVFPAETFVLAGFATDVWRARPYVPSTTVTVLDITDRAAPMLVQKTQLDGELVTSRTVVGELRLVLNNVVHLPMPIAKPVQDENGIDLFIPGIDVELDRMLLPVDVEMRAAPTSFGAINAWQPFYGIDAVYETLDQYVARVSDQVLSTLGASIRSFAADGTLLSDTPLFQATEIYRPDGISARNMTTIATFDLNSNVAGPTATTSVMMDGEPQVYATEDSIYVFSAKPPRVHDNGSVDYDEQTSVWMFSFPASGDSIELAATGEFDGSLLSQFAADEHDGYLRVVTTSSRVGGASESVLVLQPRHEHLNIVGSVSGIAPDESLYSVRFVGDELFFVTYRTIDPFFAVDLSDPIHPQVLSELKIPGYSEYLQPLDDTHILAIGRSTTLINGMWEEPDSLQISIFDVSNMASPELVDRYTFDGGYSTVTAATGSGIRNIADDDHHAVSYFSNEHILTLPIQTMGGFIGWGEVAGPLLAPGEGGLQLFRIDTTAGFIPIGLIEHDLPIARSVRIGARLFAISPDSVSVHELTNPTHEIGRVNISADDVGAIELKMFEEIERSPLQIALDGPIDDSEKSQATSTNERADPPTTLNGTWLLPSRELSGKNRPVPFTGSSNFFSQRVDNDLLQLLAADMADDETWPDSVAHSHRSALTHIDACGSGLSASEINSVLEKTTHA